MRIVHIYNTNLSIKKSHFDKIMLNGIWKGDFNSCRFWYFDATEAFVMNFQLYSDWSWPYCDVPWLLLILLYHKLDDHWSPILGKFKRWEFWNRTINFPITAKWIWDSSIFSSIKPKIDIGLFVDFCVFTFFYQFWSCLIFIQL